MLEIDFHKIGTGLQHEATVTCESSAAAAAGTRGSSVHILVAGSILTSHSIRARHRTLLALGQHVAALAHTWAARQCCYSLRVAQTIPLNSFDISAPAPWNRCWNHMHHSRRVHLDSWADKASRSCFSRSALVLFDTLSKIDRAHFRRDSQGLFQHLSSSTRPFM
jgi:hypothetical protein